MPGVRGREGDGCSNSALDDDFIESSRRRKVPRTFHYRNPTSIIIHTSVETGSEEDAQSEEVEGEQDHHHHSEQEVEEGQQSEEDEEDQEGVDDVNVEVEGEENYHQDEEEVEVGQQSGEDKEDQEDDDGLNVDEELNNGLLNVGEQEGRSSTSATRGGSSFVITLNDPGLLDCPICCEPLTILVFQCDQNGHIACSSCCTKIYNKCLFCSCPIGSNRCRAIENVVESSSTPCRNVKYGCNIPVTYINNIEHEKTCVCSPCSCPYLGCKFSSWAKELYQHFSNEHLHSATTILYDRYGGRFCFPIILKKSDSFLVVRERRSGYFIHSPQSY